MKHLVFSIYFIPAVLAPGSPLACYAEKSYVDDIYQKEVKCLATMVYGEARSEPFRGQVAVAYSALNRATKKSVCDVVLAPKQYSVFNGNTHLIRVAKHKHLLPHQKNVIDEESWQTALDVANRVMSNTVSDPTNGATHYIADKVMKKKKYIYPKWSYQYKQVASIGNHRFFKPHYPGKKDEKI